MKMGDAKKGMRVLTGFAFLSIIMGLLWTRDWQVIFIGIKNILVHQALLGTDYMSVCPSPGVSFVHSGLLMIVALVLCRLTKTKPTGITLAAIFMVYGYGFFGKSLFNVWPLFLGAYLEAWVNKKPFVSATPTALFTTSIGPLVTVISFSLPFGGARLGLRIIASLIIGVIAGFAVADMAGRTEKLHDKLIVYNVGFAAGLTLLWIYGFMKAIGIDTMTYFTPVAHHGASKMTLGLVLGLLFTYLMVMGIVFWRREFSFKKIVLASYPVSDLTRTIGLGASLFNIGFLGLGGVLYVSLLPQVNFSGEVYAAIFTLAAFGGVGLTYRSCLPVLWGVVCAAFVLGGLGEIIAGGDFIQGAFLRLQRPDMVFGAMAAQGLGPVTHRYGKRAGFLAGIFHVLLVPSVSFLHGRMLVYNHGFCTGLVATFYKGYFADKDRPKDIN